VLRRRPAGLRLWAERFEPHQPHQPLHPLAVDLTARQAQPAVIRCEP
jgi:hypothetical protein